MITTPIINYIFDWSKEEMDALTKILMLMHYASSKEGSVKFHKNKLGKQNYCWTGFAKHWVWEQGNWRVYASKEGTSFEVKEGLAKEEVIEALKDYYCKTDILSYCNDHPYISLSKIWFKCQ